MTMYIKPFSWYGGKFSHLDFILPLIPTSHCFVEVFGGSGATLLNRRPAKVEVFNDVNNDLVNFFVVLREQAETLIRAISLTPYSRREFENSLVDLSELDPLERARLFYVRTTQARNNINKPSPGCWSFSVSGTSKGMAQQVSSWKTNYNQLMRVSERLLSVQIENADALKIIERYDSPRTLFYLDPPYPTDSRSRLSVYTHELATDYHIELANVLHKIEGKAAISGYNHGAMAELYEDWIRFDSKSKSIGSSDHQSKRTESLWVNYNSPQQLSFT